MIGAVLFTSCGKDPVITPEPEPIPPTVSLVTSGGAAIADTNLLDNSDNYQIVYIKAAKGNSNLKTLTIYVDGVQIDYEKSDIYKLHGEAMSSNPILVVADTTGFTWEMWINTPNDYDHYTYTFTVEDVNGKTAETAVTYRLKEPVIVTDLDLDGATAFKFWNNKGAMKGGLDVRDGSAQSTVSGTPHIKDNGSDVWKKTISAIPGTSGFGVALKSTTGVDFSSIITKSEVEAIFEDASSTMITDESAVIAAGDIFVVRVITGVSEQITTYSLVRFLEVNETASDNDDNYVVNIKK